MKLSSDEAVREKQVSALLYTLVTLAYIDGAFDASERKFIEERIHELVDDWISGVEFYKDVSPELIAEVKEFEAAHLMETVDAIEESVKGLMSPAVGVDEARETFVSSRLLLNCFQIFSGFSEEQRSNLIEIVDRFIKADGVVHPAELDFRAHLVRQLAERPKTASIAPERPFEFTLGPVQEPQIGELHHPLIDAWETPFSPDQATRFEQAREDIALFNQASATLDRLREGGWNRLDHVRRIDELIGQDPFVDCLVHVVPHVDGRVGDYFIVGDVHGCYGCLKAVLAQTDFFARAERKRQNPQGEPDLRLIFVGDYLDRGRWGFEVMRAVCRLFVEYPEFVVPLVGNHEWLVEKDGSYSSIVWPADSIQTWVTQLPKDYFAAAKGFFDKLGSVCFLDRVVVVHGGLPRHHRLAGWSGLGAFNDPHVRLEVCWSDPVDVAEVPIAMQNSQNRFAFGTEQFTEFMELVGGRVMVRGHEKVQEGFLCNFDDGVHRLYTVFSAGGASNLDIPPESDYRLVNPHLLYIHEENGVYAAHPVRIGWERFNDPTTNRFLGG